MNSAGSESDYSNEVSVRKVVIPLNTGWNLISWDVDTPNDSVGVLLSDIMDSVVVVLGFEAGGLGAAPPRETVTASASYGATVAPHVAANSAGVRYPNDECGRR